MTKGNKTKHSSVAGPGQHAAKQMTGRRKAARLLQKGVMLTIGGLLVGIALEIFLVPNNIIDGGITGISIMVHHLTHLPLSLLIVLLNLPFLWFGYKQIGKTFAFATLFAVAVMSFFVALFIPVPSLTQDLLLAAVFGGVLLGLGVGTIIRTGGSLDGTEIVAIVLTRRMGFSVGEIVMFMNIFILGSAGLVFGWDRAMYSLIAYFVAFKTIDIVVEGLDESKSALIVTGKADEIREAILHRLGRGVTELIGRGGYSRVEKPILYCVITRLEVAKLKSIVLELDENALVAVQDVHEVIGGLRQKRAIH